MSQMQNNDPVEEKKQKLQHLITEERRLKTEIETMQRQKEEYEKNKTFYDKLIAFHKKIESLKQIKDDVVSKNSELTKANERLKLRIGEVNDAVNNKEEQERSLQELLAEVRDLQTQFSLK